VLDEALQGCLRGERAVLVLSGEPGIGKTRLLEELAARVLRAGGVSAWGRTSEVGLTPAFLPWIQALGTLETPTDPPPSLGSLQAQMDAEARLARFNEVANFLGRRAAFGPIALLFDDLHAADPSSLQLLEYVAPRVLGRPVLLALAARDTEASRETAAALGRVQRGARRLPLGRLAHADVAELVGGRADVQRVFELSEGNPLFIEELLASQASRGQLGLPELSSVRAVIRERAERLPKPTRDALTAAAIVGREFRGQVVADMIEIADIGAALESALTLGVVAMIRPDRFRFSHALVAEAMADELGLGERTRLHLRAARALERLSSGELSAIAHHFLEAGSLAAEAAVAAAERAAQQCMAQLAFEDAATLLERASHALTLSAPQDQRRRASLLCARAEALQYATQHDAAIDLCDEAVRIVRSLRTATQISGTDDAPQGDAQLLARIALVRGLEFRFGRSDPLLIALLRDSLARLGNEELSLRAKLMARLAAAEQPAADPREPIQRALGAIELAGRLAPSDRLGVVYVATAALIDYVEPEVLEGLHLQILDLARGRDRSISVHTRLRLCFTALERIDRTAFDEAVRAFTAEAGALALPQWNRHVHMLRALTALLEGRFDEAERSLEESAAISLALGDGGAAWILDVHRAMAGWIRTASVPAAVRSRVADYPPARAVIQAWFGVQDRALEATRNSLAEIGTGVMHDPVLAAMVGAAVAFAGNAREAAQVYETLASRSGRIVLASMVGSAVLDLGDRVLLVLAATAKRWNVIDLHAELALKVAGKLGSPVWTARVQADWAAALEARGYAGDEERICDLRASAAATAQRLGMPGLLEHRQRASKILDPQPPARLELALHGGLWFVARLGERAHVKNSRGMQMIARLVEQPGCALHVLDLVRSSGPVDGGDCGPALDERARNEYRARLHTLTEARAEAEARSDLGLLDRLGNEIEMLSAELERAFGLGGRERRIGAASERARSNVQRRIAHGIEQLRVASPQLADYLASTIRTGTYCVYEPPP